MAQIQAFFEEMQHRSHLCNPLIVAEIGARYAPMEIMRQMVRAAKDSGADYVKFQTYTAETITSPDATFTMESGEIKSQYDYFKSTELTKDDHIALDQECRANNIGWFSTPSHESDLGMLETFNPIAYKTGSDDLTNTPFLRKIAEKGRPVIVSTGMSTLAEIECAVNAIHKAGNPHIVLLHCVVSYPSRPEDANLRAINTLQRAFGLPVGLSDHTQDEFTSVLATQLGACMIEKHFTLDHSLKLPDHQASLDPLQWRRLADRVRLVSAALGDGIKRVARTEEKWRRAARKSIVAVRPIPGGQKITSDDVTVRRPSGGMPPSELEHVVGSTAREDIDPGTVLSTDMLMLG